MAIVSGSFHLASNGRQLLHFVDIEDVLLS
jgi:hypothetical protein